MFEKYAGTEVKYEGKEYLIVAGKISWRLLSKFGR